jgi:hypothetical protein
MDIKLIYKRKTKLHHYLDFFGKDNHGFTLYWACIKDGLYNGVKRRDIEEMGNPEKMIEYPINPTDLPQQMRDFILKTVDIETIKHAKG